MIDLSLLRHFVAVVETGSFTHAAERLRTSQSSVSRAISRLEDELGVALLERTTRKLRLTPAGDALFSKTTTGLDMIAVAVDYTRRVAQGTHARLRIGLCQSVEPDAPIIRRGLQAFRKCWPGVELILSTVMGARQAEYLRASSLDVGIRQSNPTDLCYLECRVLKVAPLMVAVPNAWGLHTDPLRLEDLSDRPWILPHPELSRAAYQRCTDIFRAAGFEAKIGGLADDRLTAQIMLACGLGAALVHIPATRNAVDGCDALDGYAVLPLASSPIGAEIETVVCWATSAMSEQVACLVECLQTAARN